MVYQFPQISLVIDEIKIAHDTENDRLCGVHWFNFIRDLSMLRNLVGIPLREKYGNIFRYVLVRLASAKYCFYVSLPSFMTYRLSVK